MAKLKSAPKVMDVVHPSNLQPTPTSRPVIVPSRPYMVADPMLSTIKGDTDAISATPRDGVTISSAPEVDKTAVNEVNAELGPVDKNEDVSLSPDAPDSTTAETPKSTAQVGPPVYTGATTSDDADEEKPEGSTDDEIQSPEAQLPGTTDVAADQAREEELERLIAKGTYAVPINTFRRRRARTTLIILTILLVAILAVDLLADMSIITLPFGLPHTSFLAG